MINEESNSNTNDEENSISARQGIEPPSVIDLAGPAAQGPEIQLPECQNAPEQERRNLSPVLSQGEGNETNSTCLICMEEWTIGSNHNLCCLRCGHLFGRSCIEHWIAEKKQQAKCPICNKPAKKSDLRDLWCKTVKASDATELNKLQKELEFERKQKKADSAVIFHQNLRLAHLTDEIENLKRDIRERDNKIARLESIMNRINRMRAEQMALGEGTAGICNLQEIERAEEEESIMVDINVPPQELKGKFFFAEKVEASSTGGCKSFALCPTSSIMLVAQSAPQGAHGANVFGAFGLRKFYTQDMNIREFIPLHSKIITSIQLKPIGDLILTSGLDKKVRLTSINNNTCVQSYQVQHDPTCVAWSSHRDQQFYVGSGNCFVTLYDIRNTSEYIYQTSQKVANTRLLSIASTSSHLEDAAPNGLLVSDSKGCQYLTLSDSSDYESETIDRSIEHLTGQQLPFDGLMGTVDFDHTTGLSLISTRHSPHAPNATHNLVRLKNTRDSETGAPKIECERVRTFFATRPAELLSQSRILKHPTLSKNVLVGACDDSARGLKLWDASDNTEYQSIRTDVFIRDMIMYTPQHSNQHMLYTLSEKGINIYRWDYA